MISSTIPPHHYSRQANEGIWKKQEDFSNPLLKHNDDLRKFSDIDIPTSPPLAINDLGGSNSLSNWSPHSSLSRGHRIQSGQHKDNHPAVTHKGKALEELERRTAADKALSVEVRLVGITSNFYYRSFCNTVMHATLTSSVFIKFRCNCLFRRQQSAIGRRSVPV